MKQSLFFILLVINLNATNFEDLVKRTLKNSPTLKKSSLQTHIAKEQINLAKSSFYPSIRLEANLQYSKKFNDNSTPSSVGDDSLTQSSYNQSSASLALSYDLFRFGGSYYELKSKEASFKVRRYEECEEQKDILLKLLNFYHKARVEQLNKQYQEKINNLYLKIYNHSKRLNKSGLISKTQTNEYAKQIADNLAHLENINENLEQSISELSLISTMDISKLNNLSPLPSKENITLINKFEQSQTYKKLINQIRQKEAELNLANTKYLPSLSLYAKYDFYGQDKHSLKDSIKDIDKNGYRVGLGFSWILFDGFKTSSTRSISLLQLETAKLDLQIAKEQFNKDLAHLNTQNDLKIKMLNYVNQSKDLSLKNNSMSTKLFKNGQIDKINSLKTQIQTLNSKLQALKTKEDLNKIYQSKKIKLSKAYICKVS